MKKNYLLLVLMLLAYNLQAQVPANDDCANATVVTSVPYNISADATQATNNAGGLDVCGSPAWGMNDGVWYTFTGNGGDVTVSVTPSGWNCQVDIYTGTCGSFSCIMGINDGSTDGLEERTFFADTGVVYFVNIGHWAYDSNNPQADSPEGPYTFSLSGAVMNVDQNRIDNLTIFYNSDEQNLHIATDKNINQVIVYDLLGNEIINNKPNQTSMDYDFSTLKKGLYLVKISTKTQTGVYKIVRR
jgi:hypothetical protein